MLPRKRFDIAYKIQKRLSNIGSVGVLIITIINILNGIIHYNHNLGQIFSNTSVYPLLIISFLLFLSGQWNNSALKFFHILIFLIIGIVSIIIESPGSLQGAIFIVFGIIITIQYGLFRKNFWWFIIVLSIFYGIAIFISAKSKNVYGFPFGVPSFILTGLLVYGFYLAFSEEIKQYSRENSELREEFERNRPFIQFGKNVAGVVHNLKSRFMAIDGFSDLIDEIGDSDVKHYAELQKDAATQILAVIDNLLSTVRSYQRAKREPLLLHKLAYGALEMLRSNMDFKHGIRVSTDFIEDDKIFASPLEILQLLDNLLKNAQEAMQGSERADLSIRTRREGAFVRLSIRDTGVGISHCPACSKRDCLRCPHFEVGNTTKENGTGLGMVFVKELVREMDGRLVIESAPGEGTSVDIWFPFFAGTVNTDAEEADARAAG